MTKDIGHPPALDYYTILDECVSSLNTLIPMIVLHNSDNLLKPMAAGRSLLEMSTEFSSLIAASLPDPKVSTANHGSFDISSGHHSTLNRFAVLLALFKKAQMTTWPGLSDQISKHVVQEINSQSPSDPRTAALIHLAALTCDGGSPDQQEHIFSALPTKHHAQALEIGFAKACINQKHNPCPPYSISSLVERFSNMPAIHVGLGLSLAMHYSHSDAVVQFLKMLDDQPEEFWDKQALDYLTQKVAYIQPLAFSSKELDTNACLAWSSSTTLPRLARHLSLSPPPGTTSSNWHSGCSLLVSFRPDCMEDLWEKSPALSSAQIYSDALSIACQRSNPTAAAMLPGLADHLKNMGHQSLIDEKWSSLMRSSPSDMAERLAHHVSPDHILSALLNNPDYKKIPFFKALHSSIQIRGALGDASHAPFSRTNKM